MVVDARLEKCFMVATGGCTNLINKNAGPLLLSNTFLSFQGWSNFSTLEISLYIFFPSLHQIRAISCITKSMSNLLQAIVYMKVYNRLCLAVQSAPWLDVYMMWLCRAPQQKLTLQKEYSTGPGLSIKDCRASPLLTQWVLNYISPEVSSCYHLCSFARLRLLPETSVESARKL